MSDQFERRIATVETRDGRTLTGSFIRLAQNDADPAAPNGGIVISLTDAACGIAAEKIPQDNVLQITERTADISQQTQGSLLRRATEALLRPITST